MAYTYQTFTSSQVLTAAQVQALQDSIRDHIHGVSDVSALAGLSYWYYRYYGDESDGSLTVNSDQSISVGEYQYTTLTVNSGKSLIVPGHGAMGRALVIRCTSQAVIQGTIMAEGAGFPSGTPVQSGYYFTGPDGRGSNNTGLPAGGAGGGGSGYAGAAYRGGSTCVAQGGVGSASDVKNGQSVSVNSRVEAIFRMYLGGGGGGGIGDGTAPYSSLQGYGGGSVIIIAPVISFTGTITVRGQDGYYGAAAYGGGGGGGVIITAAGSFAANTGGVVTRGGAGGGAVEACGSGGDGWRATITL